MLDGRSLRLPTIVVRPGKPNLAASSFASGIIREPLAGVEAFLHAHELPTAAWPSSRVVNLPGITLSVREMIEAMGRVAGSEAVGRVKFVPDADFESIVRDHLAIAG